MLARRRGASVAKLVAQARLPPNVRFVPIADFKRSASPKKTPGHCPGLGCRNIVSQNTRLEFCPMSVGAVVIVARTAVIVGTTTIKLVVGRTITTITVAGIRSRTIGVAVVSRTIIVRP